MGNKGIGENSKILWMLTAQLISILVINILEILVMTIISITQRFHQTINCLIQTATTIKTQIQTNILAHMMVVARKWQ